MSDARKRNLTHDDFKKAIDDCSGDTTLMAFQLGITRSLIYRRLKQDFPDLYEYRKQVAVKQLPRSQPVENFELALKRAYGNVEQAARLLGVSGNTVYKAMREYPYLAEIRETAKAGILDVAEDNVFKRVESGDYDASVFVLKNRGRSRGYGTHAKNELSGTLEIVVKYDDEE